MVPDPHGYPRSGHVLVAMVVSIALWAVMVLGPLAYLRRIAGGLEPFDLRPFGYDVGEARALLGALSQIGRDYYANVQLSLDTAYPATYAFSRGLLLWWLTMPGRLADHALTLRARVALLVLPVLTATFDYVENDGIRAMLAAGPRVEADLVEWASFWTQAKSIAGLLSEAMTVILSVIVFHRWWQRRQRA